MSDTSRPTPNLTSYSGHEKRGSKRHMTPLERGLALSARRRGMTLDMISEALYRDPRTLQRLFARNGMTVTIAELEDGMCKWIVARETYCGKPTGSKRERYCAEHTKVGTQPLKSRARPYIKRKY